jgi:protein phosphatase
MVQRMSDDGLLTPEAARRSRWRHALWNHLGKRSGPVDPEVISADLRWGDALLLTTDGITDPLPEGEISAIAAEPGGARSVSRKIVWAAGEKGGRGRHDPDLRPVREEDGLSATPAAGG